MNRTMLRAKIHRIAVTQCDVAYEGSLTLDPDLMRRADMVPYEKVEVYDVDNASRFATYLIEGDPGSGECCVNGAAARLVNVGDLLILASYTTVQETDVADHKPRVVLVGEGNRVKTVKEHEEAGVRVEVRAD
jgi:aspartate 1-decarboxylase